MTFFAMTKEQDTVAAYFSAPFVVISIWVAIAANLENVCRDDGRQSRRALPLWQNTDSFSGAV
jgi:hypothetical protein